MTKGVGDRTELLYTMVDDSFCRFRSFEYAVGDVFDKAGLRFNRGCKV